MLLMNKTDAPRPLEPATQVDRVFGGNGQDFIYKIHGCERISHQTLGR